MFSKYANQAVRFMKIKSINYRTIPNLVRNEPLEHSNESCSETDYGEAVSKIFYCMLLIKFNFLI